MPSGDRDRDRLLTEEVLYLHSLWRRGPPTPVSDPIPPTSGSGSLATRRRRRSSKRKRRRVERLAEPQDPGCEWPLAPSPPASADGWPDASSSSPARQQQQPPPQPSPGSIAQRAALRAADEFFSRHASGDDDEEESGLEGEEGGEEGFFMGMFERDAALRGFYEQSWEDGDFMCIGCAAGRKVRRGKARRFRGCLGLVQHARAATRCGRPRAHRALAAAVCRVLGWDIERLPSVVIDPRGTLGQALATEGAAPAAAHEAKDNADTMENDDSPNDEDAAKEDVDTRKNDSSLSDVGAAKEDVDTGKSGPSSNDNDAEVLQQENDIGSAEKEDTTDINPLSFKDTSNKEELCTTVQEEEAA